MDTTLRPRLPKHPYVLGHSAHEIERLKAQAQLIDPITERFLREAGIAPGMRVLDVGTGAGDVAFLAAGIVGPAGAVVGIDREVAALEVARARASAKALTTVSFAEAQSDAKALSQPFDAVIGRYVLQFQPDPAAMLRELVDKLKPSGLIVFHEIDWSGLRSFPPMQTFDQLCRWGADTLRRHGTESQMGLKLFETFIAAGLAPPTIRLEAPIGGIPEINSWLRMFVDLIAVLQPQMEHLGVAKSDEVGLTTLYERLQSEAELQSAVVVGHHQVGAWTRWTSP